MHTRLAAALLILLSVLPVAAQNPPAGPAAARNQAADRLGQLTTALRMASQGRATTDLDDVAAERRALILALMTQRPSAVARYALAAHERAALPERLHASIERASEVEGRLEVLYEDREDSATLHRYVHLSTGERVSLHFASEPSMMKTGDRVRVRGVRLMEHLAADGGAATVVQVASALPNTFGEQRVLLILVNFRNDPGNQPYTAAAAHNLLFSTVGDFYRENSQSQTWLTGDVAGWFTIPVDNTTCDTGAIRTYAQQAAQAAGIALSTYRRFMYAFPSNSGCGGWWGMGQVGGNPTHAWVNGTPATRVMAHELGHNFGVYHAHALECGTTTLGEACSTIEYGDPADIMGISGRVAHFSAFQKERLGWLNYGSSLPILTVQADGTYMIEPYAGPGAGPKALKILKSFDPATGRRDWYYVEFRLGIPTTFDSLLANYPNLGNGVVIHTGSESTGNSSYVLDLTPETADWNDVALTPTHAEFFDPTSGVTIKTVSVGSAGATVFVQLGTAPCVPVAPTFALTTAASQYGTAGTSATYGLSIRNNNGATCAASSFSLAATVPTGWTVSASQASVQLTPGQSASATVTVTSPSAAAPGSYALSVRATDSASSQVSTLSASYVVIGPLSMFVTSDKPSYTPGQSVALRAEVTSGGLPAAGATVTFTVVRPNGSQMAIATATTGADGAARYSLRLRTKDRVGTYTVRSTARVGTLTASMQTTFEVR